VLALAGKGCGAMEQKFGLIVEKCDKNKPIVSHFHNANEIVYIEKGSIDALISGKKYKINAPSILFINSLEVHSININEIPYVRYYMIIPNEILHNMPQGAYLGSIFTKCSNNNCNVINVSDWKEEVDNFFSEINNEYSSKLLLNNQFVLNLINCLLIKISRKHPEMFISLFSSNENTIYKAKIYIEDNYKENITVEEIANHFFISTSHFVHTFKKITGFSPKQYLMFCRLAYARNQLLNSDENIAFIAIKSGFNDVNNFIRFFKKEVGLLPLQYRKNRNLH
jgi:AraC-like DNA-binding protein